MFAIGHQPGKISKAATLLITAEKVTEEYRLAKYTRNDTVELFTSD
jgi:hypothetical protein